MTAAQTLNSAGLLIAMGGAVVLFFYGRPQPSFEGGVGLGLEDGNLLGDGRTVLQYRLDVAAERKKYNFRSKAGFALVFVGFALQLSAVWVS